MPAQPKDRKPPLTPEQALEQFEAAGHVLDRTMTAGLDFMADLSDLRAVRLQREARRVQRRYGGDSPQAKRVAARTERHATFKAALVTELQRAAVPVPRSDPEAAVLFGRVLDADGLPVDAPIVELINGDDEVIATADTKGRGMYRLHIDRGLGDEARLVVTPEKGAKRFDFGPLTPKRGSRGYRDLVLSRDVRDVPSSPGRSAEEVPDPPDRATVTVPDVTGMSAEEAVLALRAARLREGSIEGNPKRAKVTAQKPRAKAKVKPGSTVDLTFGKRG